MDSFVMKSEKSTAQVRCTNDSSIHFSQSQYVHITNLAFIGCGGNQVRQVEEFVVEDTKFEGRENSGTALELIETTAQIVNSTFVSNIKGSYRECVILFDLDSDYLLDGFIGGAIIATNSTIDTSQSKFEDNVADVGGAIFAEQDSIINMSGSIFINNNATVGGALHSHSSNVTIEACEFYDNNVSRELPLLLEFKDILIDVGLYSAGGVLSCVISTTRPHMP